MLPRPVLKAVLIGGLVGGALDLLFATTFAAFNGAPPTRVLEFIASGLLGSPAFAGGSATAALGVACHFAMSLGWAMLFALTVPHLPKLTSRPVLLGILFGVIVFACMRLIVLPLSAVPKPIVFKPLARSLDLLSHMFLFGLPIALMVCKAIKTSK
jgi:uncharacterized membrane protein YagU involved in acid resistance